VVDVLDHDDYGVVTSPFLLSVMVQRCADVLADEHLVLENTLLGERLTLQLRSVEIKQKRMRQFLFFEALKLIQNSETKIWAGVEHPFQNEKEK